MTRDEIIEDVKEALIHASYHYADDSTREWVHGRKYVEVAAKIVVEHNLTEDEIQKAYNLAKPLVTMNHLKNTCMNIRNSME